MRSSIHHVAVPGTGREVVLGIGRSILVRRRVRNLVMGLAAVGAGIYALSSLSELERYVRLHAMSWPR